MLFRSDLLDIVRAVGIAKSFIKGPIFAVNCVTGGRVIGSLVSCSAKDPGGFCLIIVKNDESLYCPCVWEYGAKYAKIMAI